MAEESDGSVILTTGYQSDEADLLAHEIRGDIGKPTKNGGTGAKSTQKAAAKKAAAAEKKAEAEERKAAKERKDKKIREEKERRKRERDAEDAAEEEPEVKKPRAKRHKKPNSRHTVEAEDEESEEEEAQPRPRKKVKGKNRDPVEVEEKEEGSEDEEEPAKPGKVPNWSKLTRDQRDLLTNGNYEVDTVNSLTHAEACRICDALRKEREQEEKEAGKLGEVVKRVEERAVKEKAYAAFTEDGTSKHHPSRYEPLGWDYEKYCSNVKRSVHPRREPQWEEELGMEVRGG